MSADDDGLIPPTDVAAAKVERILAERRLERLEPPLRVVEDGWGGLSIRYERFSIEVSGIGCVRRREHSRPLMR